MPWAWKSDKQSNWLFPSFWLPLCCDRVCFQREIFTQFQSAPVDRSQICPKSQLQISSKAVSYFWYTQIIIIIISLKTDELVKKHQMINKSNSKSKVNPELNPTYQKNLNFTEFQISNFIFMCQQTNAFLQWDARPKWPLSRHTSSANRSIARSKLLQAAKTYKHPQWS